MADSAVTAFQAFLRWKAFLRREAVDTTRCAKVPGACPIAFGTSTEIPKKVPAAGKKPPKFLPVQAWELVWTRGTRKQMDRGNC